MKKEGQKNTTTVTAGELAKLPTTAKVTVSVAWLRRYNEFAGQMGLAVLAAEDADAVPVAEVGEAKSAVGNIQVG